jgi:hypothetical protein
MFLNPLAFCGMEKIVWALLKNEWRHYYEDSIFLFLKIKQVFGHGLTYLDTLREIKINPHRSA